MPEVGSLDIIAEIIIRVVTVVGIVAIFAWLVSKLIGDREKQIAENTRGLKNLSEFTHLKITELRQSVSDKENESLHASVEITKTLAEMRAHFAENYVPIRTHDRAVEDLRQQLSEMNKQITSRLDQIIKQNR